MKYHLLIPFILILSVTDIVAQNSWSNINYSFGFSRIDIINNPRNEKSVFNPALHFDLTYGKSVFQRWGLKAGLGHCSNWVFTRTEFVQSGDQVQYKEQEDFRLNTYIRSNAMKLGIGPQFRLSSKNDRTVFLDLQYVPQYFYTHKVQFHVLNDPKLYGENINSVVTSFRHTLQLDLMVIDERKDTPGLFRCLTLFGCMDLAGYASNGKFRTSHIGIMFGM